MNLAIADMTVATFLLPKYVFVHTFTHPDGDAGNVLCRLLTGGHVTWIGGGTSVFTLVAIATERYFAAPHPFEKRGSLVLVEYRYAYLFCIDLRVHFWS